MTSHTMEIASPDTTRQPHKRATVAGPFFEIQVQVPIDPAQSDRGGFKKRTKEDKNGQNRTNDLARIQFSVIGTGNSGGGNRECTSAAEPQPNAERGTE